MSALRQYLDLYRQVGDRIDAHSAPALNALRPRAARVLEGATLPKQGAGQLRELRPPGHAGA